MDNKKRPLTSFTWKYAILVSAGLIPLMALFLYAVHEHRGHLLRSDWIIAISLAALTPAFLLTIAYYANHPGKENENGPMG